MAQADCPTCGGASLEQRGDQSGLAGPRGGYVCGTRDFGVTPVGYELESAEARKRVSTGRIARAKKERAAREKAPRSAEAAS
ncbi:hypothetical protein [Streptomyces sp. NPDC001889]